MTNRERYIKCALNQPVDRLPFTFYFGSWLETVAEWKKQGIDDPNAWCAEEFQLDQRIIDITNVVNLLYYPKFEEKILEEHEDHIIMQDGSGIVSEFIKGRSGIPRILKNPITCREDWDTIREQRLKINDAGRFSPQYKEYIKAAKEQDAPIQIGAFPYGLFGTLRDMIGVEDLCLMFYDDPDFVHDIMNYLTDFWIAMYEKVSQDIQIDIIHIWEDMSGKSGSLISPAMVREFMLPNYKKIRKFADSHNIPVMAVQIFLMRIIIILRHSSENAFLNTRRLNNKT